MKVCSIRQSAFTGLPICLSIPGGDIGTGEGLHEVCFAGTVYNRHYEKVDSEIKDITDDLPFEIPDNWAWIRLGYVVDFSQNDTVAANQINPLSWVLDLEDIEKDSGKLFQKKTMDQTQSKSDKHRFYKGNVLYSKLRPYLNKVIVADDDGYCTTEILTFDFGQCIDAQYAQIFLMSPHFVDYAMAGSYGVKMPRIGSHRGNSALIPLPPYSEQKKIITQTKELFEQIEIIEQNQAHIDTLYEEFRKRTLTLAIQGKLVPQNPNDEPASVLLERIRAEKKAKLGKKYVDSYIYKGDDNCYYEKVGETVTNINDEIPFDLPENWAWCRLQTICSYIHRGKSPTYGTEKILPIIAQKCNQWSGIQTQKCLFADRATIEKYTEEQYLCVGDIIINSTGTGTVGRTGYIDDTLFKEYPKFVADSHVTVVRPLEYIDSKYIYLFLKSPVIQTDIEAKCSGSTNQIELATKTIQSYLIPLPPAMEQHRIVSMFFSLEAKVKDED